MKYIDYSPRGAGHIPYFDYLEAVREVMPAKVYAFAADENHHTLHHPDSLHDSWLRAVEIREGEVRLALFGQQHDRIIHLSYGGVVSHNMGEAALELRQEGHAIGRDDLLYHELRIEDGGLLAHEMYFASGRTLLVIFRDFDHNIELIPRDRS